jgi:hypothetical protein
VGGLIGAVVGSVVARREATAITPLLGYWSTLAIVVALVVVIGQFVVGALIVAFALPLLQLFVSGIVAIRIFMAPEMVRGALFKQWSWVTGLALVGASVGSVVTWMVLDP